MTARCCTACGADILGNDPHAPNCPRDLSREVLVSDYGTGEINDDLVTLDDLLDDNRHDETISQDLRTWVDAGCKGDLLLLGYAGHGVRVRLA